MDPQDLENINALLDRDVELREVIPINRGLPRSQTNRIAENQGSGHGIRQENTNDGWNAQ
jgi:hypothetical protein